MPTHSPLQREFEVRPVGEPRLLGPYGCAGHRDPPRDEVPGWRSAFDRDLRSAQRGAVVGTILGGVIFTVAPLRYGGSVRELIGGLMICLGGDATFGARSSRSDRRSGYVGARAEPSAAVGGWVLQPETMFAPARCRSLTYRLPVVAFDQ